MIQLAQARRQAPSQWHHVRLDAPQLAEREHERMKMLFSRTYMAAHRPRGMTLWMTPDDADGGATCIYRRGRCHWPKNSCSATGRVLATRQPGPRFRSPVTATAPKARA